VPVFLRVLKPHTFRSSVVAKDFVSCGQKSAFLSRSTGTGSRRPSQPCGVDKKSFGPNTSQNHGPYLFTTSRIMSFQETIPINSLVPFHTVCIQSLAPKNIVLSDHYVTVFAACRGRSTPPAPAFLPRTCSSHTIPLSIVSGRLFCNGMSSGYVGTLFLASSSVHRSKTLSEL